MGVWRLQQCVQTRNQEGQMHRTVCKKKKKKRVKIQGKVSGINKEKKNRDAGNQSQGHRKTTYKLTQTDGM